MMKNDDWHAMLYPRFRWIAMLPPNMGLVDMVEQILDVVDDDETDPIHHVTQSSIWAVGMAFLDYKQDQRRLSDEEQAYASTRGGVLGMAHDGSIMITLRSLLEERDPGFRAWSQQS